MTTCMSPRDQTLADRLGSKSLCLFCHLAGQGIHLPGSLISVCMAMVLPGRSTVKWQEKGVRR